MGLWSAMTSRRLLVCLVSLGCLATGGAAAGAALAANEPRQPDPVERVHRFYPAGPSARYSYDLGSIGAVRPLVLTVTEAEAQTGVAELSFSYHTKGPGPFVVSLGVKEVGGPEAAVRPDQFGLRPAPHGGTGTVRFLVPRMEAGSTYRVYPSVNAVFQPDGVNRITLHKTLLTVDLS